MNDAPTSEARKADTGPLPALPAGPQRSVSARWLAGGAAAVAAAIVIGALLWWQRPEADLRPVIVVQEFAAAIEARDVSRMLALVEPTDLKRQVSPELRAYVEYIEEVRFDNAQYEMMRNDGERAEVRWTANMRYRISYGEVRSGEHPVDTTFVLTKIEGAWYLSSVALPEAASAP